ncbi:hydrogenase maturation nickel metallochaperone HypA [Thermanaerosceptrum fracticalcis]|uniref:Hydrogenase maturation factor HypA n=1 Tax=Thermanaerosceptrum fracticalcis TaxID=1712410 RepID=A0A7G6E3X4_THEFR|nr:hydrogenase maturation nickel metallochaperone HypA [Thermanaerosceptrum fracticalcis]QNB46778.1 hydrogenase maturation nickel metallochaperone HypA [Thermanaerosceptrum fracticalcis]
MHELSIMQSIFEIVMENAAKHRLKKVEKVHVVVGELSGVEPEALKFAFSFFARDSVAQDAEFSITTVGVSGRCRACGEKLAGITNLRCKCEVKPDYEMLTGKELYVDTITGESELEEEKSV